ncbi:HlyD family efflux transporter periplasmic adaptor subunit [Cupriavidus basilensis]|uniref:HlyD family efflux transporter periplasmic adaptor subunit n=1 Tax=Cupriavidus basilensis TaxID=68895 RepID=A0ABT6APW4_9BURK|nr:HlyD family efflux transporter periplasmic adaptor subunit [Cupriavidus basilensis]MDF3834646.1 HlyD family efflux transporter periplasmic adaptor subunit [Cupriavidus basilensis]
MRARPSLLPHFAWICLLTALAALLAGGFALRIEKIVRSEGYVKTIDPISHVVAPITGRIRSLHVVEGQVIAKDEILLTIDPDANGLSIAQAKVRHMRAAAEYAAYSGKRAIAMHVSDEEALAVDAIHRRIAAERKALQAQASELERQLEEATASLEVERATLRRLQSLEPTIVARFRLNEQLVKEGFLAPITLLSLKQETIDASQQIKISEAKAERATREVQRRRASLLAHSADVLRIESGRTTESHAEMIQAKLELDKLTALSAVTVVRAPIGGIVEQLSDKLWSNSIRNGERLFSIVPTSSSFEIALLVRNEDFPFVRVGQPVDVKFDAFPYTIYGSKKATVKATSRNTLASESDASSYKILVGLDFASFQLGSTNIPLKSGMKVSGDIGVGLQRPIDIWLEPFFRLALEALRDSH